jgi:hypothetical protein
LNSLIAFSIKQRVLVLAQFIMTFVGGLFAKHQCNFWQIGVGACGIL